MQKKTLLLATALAFTAPFVQPQMARAFDIRNGFADLVETLQPAVVNVFTTQVIRHSPYDDPYGQFGNFFEYFFGMPNNQYQYRGRPYHEEPRKALGSGFIISPDGYALTNYHVVENADSITIKLLDEREFSAKVIGFDKDTDVALLKIDTNEKLPAVKMGDSDKMRIGDWVVAIGNPFGLSHTVTAGIVSAKERVLGSGPYDQFIQTDASINPGNSGGPLFNLNGEVIGINTAIIQQAQGLGFAIPVNIAKNIVDQLRSKGKVSRGWLGVSAQELTADLAEGFGQKDLRGALIAQVYPDSPAAKAGLVSGDIVIAVGGKKIHNPTELTTAIGLYPPGSGVDLTIIRDGKQITLKMKLGDREAGMNRVKGIEPPNVDSHDDDFNEALEVEVSNISKVVRQRLNLPDNINGVVIDDVDNDSPLREVLRVNDIIISVNKVKINKIQDFTKTMRSLKKGQKCLFHVWRNGGAMYIATRLPE